MSYSPLSHLIALGLLVWLWLAFRRIAGEGELRWARVAVIAVLAAWAVASSAIAYRGYYLALHEDYLLMTGGIAMPYVLLGALAAGSRSVRALFARFVERMSLESLTRVHVVRIAALGTIYKWYVGALPGHFILPIGFPDLLIGLTALPMSRRAARTSVARDPILIGWNLVGAGLLLAAVPLIFASQPGPLQLVSEGVRTDEVLSFPMSIIPTLAAPLFVALHAAALVKLRRA